MSNSIIIGSTAIKYFFPDFHREPKDLDIAVEDILTNRYPADKKIEYLVNPVILKYSAGEYLDPDLLLTLKMSHLFWDINWDKHMFDVQFLLRKGCTYDKQIFLELYEYWNSVHPKNKRSDLTLDKEDFFNNAINTELPIEHDYLHTLINPIPVYTRILREGRNVELDESKYNLLTYEEKVSLVREEVYVMAWERYRTLDYRKAYIKMIKKFIIGHAPIYLALFIIENYIRLHKPHINFINTINNGLQTN